MPQPWEKYQSQTAPSGGAMPWEKYSGAQSEEEAQPAGVPAGVKLAGIPTGHAPIQMDGGPLEKLVGANPLHDAATVVGGHLKGAVTGIAHTVADKPTGLTEKAVNLLGPGALPVYRSVVKPTVQAGGTALRKLIEGDIGNPMGHYDEQGNYTPSAVSSALDAIPLAGPWARGIETDAHQHGAVPALLGAGTDVAAGEAAGGLVKLPGVAKSFVTGDLDAPIVGSNMTPRTRFEAAKRVGVNLDAADATNSPLLGNVKRMGEHSLLGGHVYDSLKASNTAALGSSMDNFLTKLYDGDREAGGAEIQNALKADHAGLHDSAREGFDTLADATGNSPVPGAANVGMSAKRILAEQAPYFKRFPSLRPAKTMGVIEDVSDLAPADPKVGRVASPAPADWSTMHRLGSDLHNLSANNPDLIKTRAQSWIQKLEGENGAAIRDAGAGLTPELRPIFDRAHADWADMKATYDNPSSPFYSAVRTDSPSTLSAGLPNAAKSPELARNLIQRLSLNGEPTPAVGALRRGTVESALKPTAEGVPNFKNFPLQLNRIPAEYRAELFSPDQNETLRDLTSTSNVLGKDFNPSGSAKQGQKVLEGGALASGITTAATGHPIIGGLAAAPTLLQYPASRLMTSPAVSEWLMKPKSIPPSTEINAATIGAEKRKKN